MMILVMVLLVEGGMVHIIATHTRRERNAMFAVIWRKHLLSHLTTMEEDLQFTEEIFIYQLHKKESTPGLSTSVMILFVSYNMLDLPLMLAVDGAQQNQLVWAETDQTLDYTNILWRVVLSIYRLEMFNT